MLHRIIPSEHIHTQTRISALLNTHILLRHIDKFFDSKPFQQIISNSDNKLCQQFRTGKYRQQIVSQHIRSTNYIPTNSFNKLWQARLTNNHVAQNSQLRTTQNCSCQLTNPIDLDSDDSIHVHATTPSTNSVK